jgi:DNA-binding winged helix-turn-helix (wHTH) protein
VRSNLGRRLNHRVSVESPCALGVSTWQGEFLTSFGVCHVFVQDEAHVGGGTGKNVFRFGCYELDQPRFELRRFGTRLEVQPRVLEVLAYLVEHHDRLVTKDELVAGPWEGTCVGDDSLYRAVLHVRAALDAEPGANPIRTVRGKGFRFVWPVTIVEPTPSREQSR